MNYFKDLQKDIDYAYHYVITLPVFAGAWILWNILLLFENDKDSKK